MTSEPHDKDRGAPGDGSAKGEPGAKVSREEVLDRLPDEPGVYIFRDRKGRVVYVGTASNLRTRVRSYFQPGTSDTRYFIPLLDQVLGDIETTVTPTRQDAKILESNLIKEHQPRYNVRLRDDKDFLHLRIDLDAEWPRLELVRRPRPTDRSGRVRIFGPFHSARAARRTMLLVSRFFRLRTCKDSALRKRQRPCLLYQMDRCPGVCVFDVDREAYLEQVRHACLFLAGKHDELTGELNEKMSAAAADMAYEKAALYRDQIRAIEETLARQHVVHLNDVDEDVFGLAQDEVQVHVVVLQVRAGKIVGRHDFHRKGKHFHDSEADLLSSVIAQYYEPDDVPVPQFVLIPEPLEDAEPLAAMLSERRGRKVTVHWPRRGRRLVLVRMAQTNARRALELRARSVEDMEATLATLAQKLGLAEPPRTIECIDVAHRGSGRAVAAIAQLRDGEPSRAGTRSFTVKTAKAGDDYGSMYEVLSRRFRRAREGDDRWALPDLLVVDGGRGQLAVAQAALRDVGLSPEQLPLAGLAKERSGRRGPDERVIKDDMVERVYTPGRVNPIQIRGTSPLLLLCRVRDEAHRLAGKLLARRDKAKALGSPLDEIPGVGPKLRKALLRELGSLKAVEGAAVEQLRAVTGVGPALAQRIYQHFHGPQG